MRVSGPPFKLCPKVLKEALTCISVENFADTTGTVVDGRTHPHIRRSHSPPSRPHANKARSGDRAVPLEWAPARDASLKIPKIVGTRKLDDVARAVAYVFRESSSPLLVNVSHGRKALMSRPHSGRNR